MNTDSFTVAICAYNREREIALCLGRLTEILAGDRSVPILVIDNNSRDRTAEVAAGFEQALNLRVIREEKQGLSHARNRATAECSTEYIVFLDDDAKPCRDWIAVIRATIAAHHPDVFGGPYGPFYLEQQPRWFKDEYGSSLFDLKPGPFPPERSACGGNMALRVSLIRDAGGFPTDVGMSGGKVGVGEETALQQKLRATVPGYCSIYVPEMEIDHLVPAYKFPLKYWIRRAWLDGWHRDDVDAVRRPLTAVALLKQIVRLLLVPVEYLLRDRRAMPYWQNYVFEVLRDRIRFWGWVWRRLHG